jgi:Protein of unknown function (DUF4236)
VGFRVRKSFKLAPGVRMTVTPRGIGVSAGPRGAKLSVHSSGRVTQTLSLPGSGISHTQTLRASAPRPGGSTVPTSPSRSSEPDSPLPGLFAPKWEKQLWTATIRRPSPPDIADVAKLDPRSHHVVAFLETVMHLLPSADLSAARRRVEWLWSSGYDPARDPFLNRYMPDLTIMLGLTAEITAALPADRDALGLLLAELRQATGDAALAIDCAESLTPSSPAAVSLAELYASQNRWRDIVDLTNELENHDELLTYLLIQRGVAFRELRMFDAARESLKKALAARSRPAALRHLALVERGQCYLAESKRAMARKDFHKVLAENANYPGLADHRWRSASEPGVFPASLTASDTFD